MFDPECHRQVLGNRQKKKSKGTKKGEGGSGEEEGEPVRQGGTGRGGGGPNLREAAAPGSRTEAPSTSPGSGPVNSSDCCG